MEINFTLGGNYENKGKNILFPLLKSPSISDLITYLNIIKIHDGVLSLRNDQEENCSPYELTLYSDKHRYLVMLATKTTDGDIDVRTLDRGPPYTREFISILGEPYAKSSVVEDFSLVTKAFVEFLKNGDVGRELLD